MHSRGNHGWRALAAAVPAIAVVVMGCAREAPPPFPDHLAGYLNESPNAAFSLYLEAARQAEADAGSSIARVNWTPDRKKAAIAAAEKAIALLDKASGSDFEFVYSPTSPITPHAERRGWRFIARTLVWRIEDAVRGQNFSQAAKDFDRLVRFGTNLSGGDAIDANLGYSVIREGRDVLWSAFPLLSPDDLRKIHASIVKALGDAPPPHTTLRHDRAAMLKAVSSLQEAFLAGDLAPYREALGKPVAPAFDYLDSLRKKPVSEQVSYFERFAREANAEADRLNHQAALAPHLWQEEKKQAEGERPWFRFANHYFRNGELFLTEWAEHQAWMRLMAIDAALLARVKDKQNLPADLTALRDWLRADPYSGRDFVYVPQGADYRLYGVGPDRKDDFGAAKVDMSPPWK